MELNALSTKLPRSQDHIHMLDSTESPERESLFTVTRLPDWEKTLLLAAVGAYYAQSFTNDCFDKLDFKLNNQLFLWQWHCIYEDTQFSFYLDW